MIQPINEKVLIKLVPREITKSEGGLMLPPTRENTRMAEVISVGNGRYLESGQLIPPAVKAGDMVVILDGANKYSVEHENQRYHFISDDAIGGIIK